MYFLTGKCNGEKESISKTQNGLIRTWKKQGFLSNLKTHIMRSPDGEIFPLFQMAHG